MAYAGRGVNPPVASFDGVEMRSLDQAPNV